jgi:hypothetical protein
MTSYHKWTWGTRLGYFLLQLPFQHCLSTIFSLCNQCWTLLVVVLFHNSLFGLTNVQTFIYFQTQRDTGMTPFKLIVCITCCPISQFNDHWRYVRLSGFGTCTSELQLLNTSICTVPRSFRILDAFHLALIVHCIYHYLVTKYANFNALTEIVWSLKVSFPFLPSMQPFNTYDLDVLVQLQVILDVSCFLWILRFAQDTHLTGFHCSYGTFVSSMCNVTRNTLIGDVPVYSSYIYRIWIGRYHSHWWFVSPNITNLVSKSRSRVLPAVLTVGCSRSWMIYRFVDVLSVHSRGSNRRWVCHWKCSSLNLEYFSRYFHP